MREGRAPCGHHQRRRVPRVCTRPTECPRPAQAPRLAWTCAARAPKSPSPSSASRYQKSEEATCMERRARATRKRASRESSEGSYRSACTPRRSCVRASQGEGEQGGRGTWPPSSVQAPARGQRHAPHPPAPAAAGSTAAPRPQSSAGPPPRAHGPPRWQSQGRAAPARQPPRSAPTAPSTRPPAVPRPRRSSPRSAGSA